MLRTLPIPAGAAIIDLLPQLENLLDGKAGAVLPVPMFDARETARLESALSPGTPIEDDVALVVATSGTTGTPKGAMLPASALRASAAGTHERLGGPGSWLLALTAHHIAGMQVLLRSIAAGSEPVIIDVSTGFDPLLLPGAISRMTGPRRYTSLVPNQLIKALDHPDAVAALASLDAVLLGGAATPVPLRERAAAAGINIVRTYGMSETAGGCVYDGVPLSPTVLRIDDGRVVLGGDTLARGYRGLPDHPAFAEPGWFRTDDAGTVVDGILAISGRLDEAITVGGLTVVPQVVEAALATHPSVRECAVVGLKDARLGHSIAAVIVAVPGSTITLGETRTHIEQILGVAAAPRELFFVDALPMRGPGKVDRRALAEQCAAIRMGRSARA